MKTFDDFAESLPEDDVIDDDTLLPQVILINREEYKQIQLDAKRAGMTEAARINLKGDLPKGMEEGSMTAYHWLNGFVSAETKFANAILSARDKATV